jgi:hypothetical protein
LVQRGRLYSNTGKTGCGKTAVMLQWFASVALGREICGHEVEGGRCLMLVGENPDDVRARWIGLSEKMGFDPDRIDVHFKPGVFPILEMMPLLEQTAQKLGGLSMVGIDTGAAYFGGKDENDNKQMGDYARLLRVLTALPGRPCTLVNTHPIKNASEDNLLPRGGGAFLNEVDGNLCCQRTGDVTNIHWQGKFRGADFQPISYELVTTTSPQLVDSKGRPLPTVYAKPLSAQESETREDAASADQKKVLVAMMTNQGASVAELAETLGWMSRNVPLKSKVHRAQKELEKQGLAKMELNRCVLTAKGIKVAPKLAGF